MSSVHASKYRREESTIWTGNLPILQRTDLTPKRFPFRIPLRYTTLGLRMIIPRDLLTADQPIAADIADTSLPEKKTERR